MKPPKGLAAVLLVASAALVAKDKKPSGEIPDRAAFAKIRSYCIESNNLSDAEAYEVQGFIQSESKPKGLLSKLSWKLDPDCREADPDAVIKVDFPRLRNVEVDLGVPPNPLDPPDPADYRTMAVLQISEAGSSRLLYKVQALPRDNPALDSGIERGDSPTVMRRNALYNAFMTLISDAKLVAEAGKGKDASKK